MTAKGLGPGSAAGYVKLRVQGVEGARRAGRIPSYVRIRFFLDYFSG